MELLFDVHVFDCSLEFRKSQLCTLAALCDVSPFTDECFSQISH